VGLFFRQATRWIAAVAIGAPEHDVFGFVHWLDALMALQTADALCIGLGLRLIDPISRRQSCACDCRPLNGNRSRRAVALLRSTKHQTPSSKKAPSSNY
jgi:hypothetical protein